jgi:hypothetical protein
MSQKQEHQGNEDRQDKVEDHDYLGGLNIYVPYIFEFKFWLSLRRLPPSEYMRNLF